MSERFVAKKYASSGGSAMGSAGDLGQALTDYINLSIGDPNATTDEQMIQSALKDALAGHTRYTDPRGDKELRHAIISLYEEDYQLKIADEEIFVVAGGLAGMYLALKAVLDPGDEVIIPGPYFPPYKQQVAMAGGIPIELNTAKSNFQIDKAQLESLITDKTKAIILNTPNNPTGKALTLTSLEVVKSVAEAHDLLVVADDIYTIYSFADPFIPIMGLDGMKERTITINSSSKDYTMTGWRVGAVIAPVPIIQAIKKINENVVYSAPSVSQRAWLHGIKRRKEIQPAFSQTYKERLTYGAGRLNQIPGFQTEASGTFYLWVDIRETGLTSEEVCKKFLEEAQVIVIPGTAFGASGAGYIRIACTVGGEKLEEAFDRIEKLHWKQT